MRVGFITHLLWPRYGDFWVKLVSGAGLTPVYAPDEGVRRALSDPRLAAVPGTAFRLAAAQALALSAEINAEIIIAPDLNPAESSSRGGGQEAFIANFPEALATTLSGLPPVIGVPADLTGEELETLVVSTLLNLTHDAGVVRRTWERQRSSAKAPRLLEPRWRVNPSEGGTVGVVGQPWLLSDALVKRALGERHAVSQHQLEPQLLREEGRRSDPRLIATDAEVLGAARFLGRKGSISELVILADETSGADAWLVSQVQRAAHKPVSVVYLQQLGAVSS